MKLLWMLPLVCGKEMVEVESGFLLREQTVRVGLLLLRLHHRLLVLVVTSSTTTGPAGSNPPVGRTRTSLLVVRIHFHHPDALLAVN
jgi:hypothetical protein